MRVGPVDVGCPECGATATLHVKATTGKKPKPVIDIGKALGFGAASCVWAELKLSRIDATCDHMKSVDLLGEQ